MKSEVIQSCPKSLSPVRLFVTPRMAARQACPGVLQAGTLEGVATPFSRDLPDPGIEPRSPALQEEALTSEPPEKPVKEHDQWIVW